MTVSPEYVAAVVSTLQNAYPDAHCELSYQTPVQLLVAVILSAQSTDVRVNQVTPALFERYPDAAAFANAERAELEQLIYTIGFYRQKAKAIQLSCQRILTHFDGQVPDNLTDLLSLHGVARKTANVILNEIYRQPAGVVVDTHVCRISQLLGLTQATDPVKIERDLSALLAPSQWGAFSHYLIWHGRRVCVARRPRCNICPLATLCPASPTFQQVAA